MNRKRFRSVPLTPERFSIKRINTSTIISHTQKRFRHQSFSLSQKFVASIYELDRRPVVQLHMYAL
ncbi:hypothetical protein PRIPAC_97737 [Pristionchus pacificus]|uniref:Uncharacterized protein n=1 Tax=Pristionchus pacificus TaxID=54126 RepID=A0A2A6BCG6_PRIPA|nr:hypothetical protein PRIPAC_97737 [Pristionchus pacificus]|eukprot:PDM63568.1 hypothetical protein PRIPAC_49541 [Pristionchus pacificus]